MYNIRNYLITKVEKVWQAQSRWRSKDNRDRRTSDHKAWFCRGPLANNVARRKSRHKAWFCRRTVQSSRYVRVDE